MRSPHFEESRSCGAGREIGKATLAERDSHDPCWCLCAPLASNNADASTKCKMLWGKTLALSWPGSCGAATASRAHGATARKTTLLVLGGVGQGLPLNPMGQEIMCWMAQLFLTGPLVEISVCTWRHALDGRTFSQWSLDGKFCVHLVSCAGWLDCFSRVP